VAERYIWISRWEEFQHYRPERDRAPAWIKDYTKQLDDDRYLELTDRQRALLRDLRDLFALKRGRLSVDVRATSEPQLGHERATTEPRLSYDLAAISRRRNRQTYRADLKALKSAGFIEVLSRPTLELRLEKFYSPSSPPRARIEVEVEEERTLSRDVDATRNGPPVGWPLPADLTRPMPE
jgi:hypothetical protein